MQELASFAKHLAEGSGAIIRQYFRTSVQIDDKADGSPVTIADRKAEEFMRGEILRHYPAHGIIGEEFGRHNPDSEYQWVLDPIDGTKNFIAGSFLFGTLIALMHQGRPILGALHHPLNHMLLIGAGGETRLNGEKAQVRPCARIEDALLLSSLHYEIAEFQDMVAFESLARRAGQYRMWADCHGYFLLATGYADIMLDPVMEIWDFMALIPIVEGAGGTITDWHGRDPIGGHGIVATAGSIHAQVIAALNPSPTS